MTHDMGHGAGMDMQAMARDMRNRFWIALIFTVPIFVYSPMGGMFAAPAPPSGLRLNVWLFLLASAAVLWPSWPFFTAAWHAVRNGVRNMAVLVVLSVDMSVVRFNSIVGVSGGPSSTPPREAPCGLQISNRCGIYSALVHAQHVWSSVVRIR